MSSYRVVWRQAMDMLKAALAERQASLRPAAIGDGVGEGVAWRMSMSRPSAQAKGRVVASSFPLWGLSCLFQVLLVVPHSLSRLRCSSSVLERGLRIFSGCRPIFA